MIQEITKIEKWSIGSDCEVFLQDKNSGEIVTAENIIQGTKENPFNFDKSNKYYATSLDCVLAEFNIPPCKTAGDFYLAMQHALKYINNFIPDNLQTAAIPVARLAPEQLTSVAAQTFGCQPSLNCWTLEEIHPLPKGDNARAAGYHIHVGYKKPNVGTNLALGKAMDLFLGIPSVILEPENERKSVGYGCAGNIRQQKHGKENKNTI